MEDAILEIFIKDKYCTPLSRGDDSSVDFLCKLFDDYVSDLKNSIVPEKNPLYGATMCELLSSKIGFIEEKCHEIINIFEEYNEGKLFDAVIKAEKCFNSLKDYFLIMYSGSWRTEVCYRIREYSGFNLERKELFHVPLAIREWCSTERYSLSGYPCLYLSTQAELCWYECNRPTEFAISKFEIPQEKENHLCFIDFSEKMIPLAHSFVSWRSNANKQEEINKIELYLLKHLVTYPVRAACSIMASYDQKVAFKEEYVFPQLLLQWVNSHTSFDGIKYESVSKYSETRLYGGSNIVLVSKGYDKDGYAKNLRGKIKIATPKLIKLNELYSSADEYEKYIFESGLETGPNDYDFL